LPALRSVSGVVRSLDSMSIEATSPVTRPVSRVGSTAVLAVVAVAQFMIILDASIVNVALPTIKSAVRISDENLSWILNAYTLMFGGFLLLGGRLADRLGRRRLLMVGIALFSGASLLCGVSESQAALLVGRGLQGLGGALVSPAALAIILTTFAEGDERDRALAVWAAVAGAGGAVGMLVGGTLVEELGWRSVFFVNVPIGLAMLALAPRIVPESRAEAVSKSGYDIEGAIVITLGTMGLVYTLTNAGNWEWTSPRTIGGLIVSLLLIALFVLIERRHEDPLVPLRIFSNRKLSVASVTLLVVAAALFGIFFFVTLYLQQVLGFTAFQTGIAYLPLSLTIIAASAAASRLVDLFRPKPVLIAGLLITIGGFVLLATLSGHGDYESHVVPAMIMLGIGPGISFVPIMIAGTSGVAPEDSGLASGLLNTTQQVGGALGLAVLSTVAADRTANALSRGLTQSAALTYGFSGAYIVSAALCAVGAVIVIALLPRRKLEHPHEHVKAVTLSFARFPSAPQWGYHARVVGLGRRLRQAFARA
jgi:EmrB/QacA subfamily drug resistance transporter